MVGVAGIRAREYALRRTRPVRTPPTTARRRSPRARRSGTRCHKPRPATRCNSSRAPTSNRTTRPERRTRCPPTRPGSRSSPIPSRVRPPTRSSTRTGKHNGIVVNANNVTIKKITVQERRPPGHLRHSADRRRDARPASVNLTLTGNVVMNNDACSKHPTSTDCPPPDPNDDYGEAIQLLSVVNSTVTNNTVTNNVGGILMTDEMGPNHDNTISNNTVSDNLKDCGITLASHNPTAVATSGANAGQPQPTLRRRVPQHDQRQHRERQRRRGRHHGRRPARHGRLRKPRDRQHRERQRPRRHLDPQPLAVPGHERQRHHRQLGEPRRALGRRERRPRRQRRRRSRRRPASSCWPRPRR